MAAVSLGVPVQNAVPALQTFVPQSSWISLFEYDQQNLSLTVHLKDNSIYQSKMVFPLEWTALQTAQNHGSHWAKNIKGKKLSVRLKSAKAPKSEIKRRKA